MLPSPAQVDPLVSAWCPAVPPAAAPVFAAAAEAFTRVTPASLELLDGYSHTAVLADGTAPRLAELELPPAVQLVVSRAPPAAVGPAAAADPPFASLMLHGWLFAEFAGSARKAHQKFPLFSLHSPVNLRAVPGRGIDPPAWLPTTGAVGWADQHVHRDEPIDLGGFLFAEVFFGSDMARVAFRDPGRPAMVWAVAADAEAGRGLVVLCVVLPPAGAAGPAADPRPDAGLDTALQAAGTPAEVAAALRGWYPAADVDEIARAIEALGVGPA